MMMKIICRRTLGLKVLLGAAALVALGAGAARAQETLGPVVREAITQVNRAAEGIERARRRHAERTLPLEEERKRLEGEIARAAKESPERGLAEANYLEAAARLNHEYLALVDETLRSLEALAPALGKLQEAARRGEGGREVEESAARMRRMVGGLLQMSSGILVSVQLAPEKSAQLRQVEDTLLLMQKAYGPILHPTAAAQTGVQLEALFHAISATHARTQALRDLLSDQRARMVIANTLAQARLLALKIGRLGGAIEGAGAGFERAAGKILEWNGPIDRMIERELGGGSGAAAEPYRPGARLRGMSQGNVFGEESR